MAGTIIETAESVEDQTAEQYKICGVLMGPSGSGKSTAAAATLPGRKLVLEYDGREQSLVGLPNVKVIKLHSKDFKSPQTWMDAEKLRKELWVLAQRGKLEYDSIIEDGLTMMSRYAMSWALLLDPKRGLGDTPAKQHYMPQMKEISEHVLSMKALPVNYVLTAHLELIENEENKTTMWLPKVTGKLRTEVAGWFNECYYCYRKEGPKGTSSGLKYYWITGGTGEMDFFKSSLNQFGKYWRDPVEVDLDKKPAGFQMLLEKRFGSAGQ